MTNAICETYYAETAGSAPNCTRLNSVVDCHTCIVGGGYAGLMTQLGLLQRDVTDVVLLESETLAAGASGRNGGFVFGGYSLSPRDLLAAAGEERAKALYQLSLDAVELIRQRVEKFSINCDLVEEGVILANWFRSQKHLHAEQQFMREHFGVEWQYLSPQALRNKIKSDRYCGGLFEAKAMHFHPLKYAYGIAQKNLDLGGAIYEKSGALTITRRGSQLEVQTAGGTVRCKNVVVCAGGYIKHFYPKVARAVLPIATYVMVTEVLPENYSNSLFSKAAIYDTRFAFDYYRPLPDGRLLWGGRISADTTMPNDLTALLRRDLARVFPHLRDVAVTSAWSGLMAYPRHQMPLIDQVEPNIWCNTGFGGHGVGPTTVGGELVASAIADGDQRYRMFAPWGLEWAGGKFGAFAAGLSYRYFRLRDALRDVLS